MKALAALPLLLCWPQLAQRMEASMFTHMLLQWPLLLLAGAAATHLARRRWPALGEVWSDFDAHGLAGGLALLCVSAFWMIPAALDAALLSPALALVKTLSWWLTGAVLALSLPRWSDVMLLFVLGNLAWMTASVGLLYHAAPTRLCVNYLQDEQAHTGIGLVLLSLALLAWTFLRLLRSARAEPA